MNFWNCFFYLVIVGIISFLFGRIVPKKWFHADRFPFRAFRFEDEGRIYNKLHVRSWHNKVLDMSKILPKMMPAKNLSGDYKSRLPLLLQETCVAELIHSLNCVAALYCLKLYPGMGGIIVTLLYIVFLNLPYIIIQRYNRPKLQKLAKRVRPTGATSENKDQDDVKVPV